MIGTTQYVIGPTPIYEPYTPSIVVCNKSVIAATLSVSHSTLFLVGKLMYSKYFRSIN